MLNSLMRGRFAPSPTGFMHLGNAWTALLAWLQVRSSNGIMVLRIEDLDQERSRVEYIRQLIFDLKWLGLDWDEGPDNGGGYGSYLQSDRQVLYRDIFAALMNSDAIYPCFCSRHDLHQAASAPHGAESSLYRGTCARLTAQVRREKIQAGERHCWRFKMPSAAISFHDLVYGFQSYPSDQLDDFIIFRSDGVAAYQLAVVVDDAAMKITHILRGADLLSSAARQIALYEALHLPVPEFAHVPLLLGEDGHRLSKRHRDITIVSLRDKGIKAEEIIGWLAFQSKLIDRPFQVRPIELVSGFTMNKLPKTSLITPSALFF